MKGNTMKFGGNEKKKVRWGLFGLAGAALVLSFGAPNGCGSSDSSHTESSSNLIAAPAETLQEPTDITVDAAGNVFVITGIASQNGAVVEIPKNGSPSLVADLSKYRQTFGIVADTQGNLYVPAVRTQGNRAVVLKITSTGRVSELAGGAASRFDNDGIGAGAAFIVPIAPSLDAKGNLHVLDSCYGSLALCLTYERRVDPFGVTSSITGWASPSNILGAAFFPGTKASYATVNNQVLHNFLPFAGTSVAGNADGVGRNARFNAPTGIVADSLGNVYVADTGNHTIRKITSRKQVTTLAGAPGIAGWQDGTGVGARFYAPYGIAVDASGNLYVTDSKNNAVRKITPAGVVTTLASPCGTGCPTGELCSPTGVCVACASDNQPCGTVCANQSLDFQNCGGCGIVCPNGQTCLAGGCTPTCADGGQKVCGNTCFDVQSDPNNCGACGNFCGGACVNGKCTCADGQTRCGRGAVLSCFDIQNDIFNCGACAKACKAGKVCSSGSCVSCPVGQTVCDSHCVNLKTDTNNCGACGTTCDGGTCSNGHCSCPSGELDCNGKCVVAQTDENNCGACGKTCDGTCTAGVCVCSTGQTACTVGSATSCKAFTSDNANCGTCGHVCGGSQVCQNGVCAACPSGKTDCSGVCADLNTDVSNCGACGQYCGGSCVSGICTCPSGTSLCSNICRSLDSDSLNCGACNHVCPGTQACISGACTDCGQVKGAAVNQGGQIYLSPSSYSTADGVFTVLFVGTPWATYQIQKSVSLAAGFTNLGDPIQADDTGVMSIADPVTSSMAFYRASLIAATTSFTNCNGACVDLQSDSGNCGACGQFCGGTCVAGGCMCPNGTISCATDDNNTFCRNTQFDRNNCGGCGNVCTTGQYCGNGICFACPDGQVSCAGACVDLSSDLWNCGGCGQSCSGGICQGGACVCPLGKTFCNGQCRDLMNDSESCGNCGSSCTTSQVCSSGAIVQCSGGKTACNNSCVNLNSDPNNCGGCFQQCGAATCVSGACVCPIGQTLCDGQCVNAKSDYLNCGACGQYCAGTCSNGICSCPSGSGDSLCKTGNESYCSQLDDYYNCGACNHTCSATQQCTEGSCTSCASGQVSCYGTCANLQTDKYNCGACGAYCNETCTNGICGCPFGKTFCGSQCRDLQSDPTNCGGCGKSCGGGRVCTAGVCTACGAGQTICGSTCVNLQNDNKNCGWCYHACANWQACVSGSCYGADYESGSGS